MQISIEQKTGLKDKFCVIENWAIENINIQDKQDNPFAIQYGLNNVFTVLYSGNMGRLHDIESIVYEPLRVQIMGQNARKLYEERYIFKRALDEYENLLFNNSQL